MDDANTMLHGVNFFFHEPFVTQQYDGRPWRDTSYFAQRVLRSRCTVGSDWFLHLVADTKPHVMLRLRLAR